MSEKTERELLSKVMSKFQLALWLLYKKEEISEEKWDDLNEGLIVLNNYINSIPYFAEKVIRISEECAMYSELALSERLDRKNRAEEDAGRTQFALSEISKAMKEQMNG